MTAEAHGSARGLVMVSDEDLLDGLLRLAAAAGCELQRVIDPGQARRSWTDAPLILLDVDAADRCARAALPRRDDVVVVAVSGEPPPQTWQTAVAIGATNVVALPEGEAWLVGRLAEAADAERGRGAVLAVIGGRGGAGASVLAVAVAITAVRDGGSALLVDCDPLGGGIDLALGAEDRTGLRWPGIDVGAGRVRAAALHAALPALPVAGSGGELAVLACDRSAHGPTPEALRSVLDAGRRGGDKVVCDLPRYPTDTALAALQAADLTVLVVPADVRAAAAAERVAAVLTEHARRVRLVVRGPAPGGVGADDLSGSLRLPLLATMRPEPNLDRDLENGATPGRPRGPLAHAARAVLDELARVTVGSAA